MSNKHVGLAVVIILIICLVQGTLWMNNRMKRMQTDAQNAKNTAITTFNKLQIEQGQLIQLRNNSKELIDFLAIWQPYFDAIDSPQNAELGISLGIKREGLISLSQRYEVASAKNNASIPSIMRASLTFEDNYARLLNWLGQIEAQAPTVRLASLRLSKGTNPNDIKMDLVLEQPLSNRK